MRFPDPTPSFFLLRPVVAVLLLVCPLSTRAQGRVIPPAQAVAQDIDPGLWQVISATAAIDNHAHPVLPPPDQATDRNFDALPVDNMEPETDVVAWTPNNPELPLAWQALWDWHATLPLDPSAQARLEAARNAVRAREGQQYDQWVLDQSHIQTMLANRVALGPGLEPPRFRWVPYLDPLVFPLDNSSLAAASPDRKQFFALEDHLRGRYLQSVHRTSMPPTLDGYLAEVLTPTLERLHAGGAVAVKFEIAYLRSFEFSNPPRAEAARVYARFARGGTPPGADYKLLQDFLFRTIAAEAGHLGMAVHLHTMAGGGGYFSIAGANPLLLEPLFNDPALRQTRFVLLHGGWPFVREAGALLQKPNVFLDFSQESLTFPPRTLAIWLREWLETFPDKVLFGTDGYPYSAAMGWEESTWLASRNAREALGLALSGMLRDGEISPDRAAAIARNVLHNTAANLYGIP